MTREVTNKLWGMAEDGLLTWEAIAKACLVYMSESEVADMAHDNELYTRQDAELEEEGDME